MKAYIRTLILLFLALNLINCSELTPEPQEACNFAQNSDEQRLSWGSNLPIRFKIHEDVPLDARESILRAAQSWNTIASRNIIEFSDLSAPGSPADSYADGEPMIFWRTEWEANKVSEQGRSIIVFKGSSIIDADIWINAKNFNFTYIGQPFDPIKVDLVSLLVHEMGHALGLEHNKHKDSVMFASLKRGYDRRDIDHLGDIESFGCEYGEELLDQNHILALLEKNEASSGNSGSKEVGEGGESVNNTSASADQADQSPQEGQNSMNTNSQELSSILERHYHNHHRQ